MKRRGEIGAGQQMKEKTDEERQTRRKLIKLKKKLQEREKKGKMFIWKLSVTQIKNKMKEKND